MINVDYNSLTIGTLPINTASLPTLVSGRAVYVNSSGYVDSVLVASSRVLGLSKESYISGVVNELTGGSGIYGSGKASVVCHGICTVQQSVYNGVSYNVYDQTQTYSYGQDIYATVGTGILTNQTQAGAGPNGITSLRVGRVLNIPANAANGNPMQITVECA